MHSLKPWSWKIFNMLLSDSLFGNCRFSSDFLFIYTLKHPYMEKTLHFPFNKKKKLEYNPKTPEFLKNLNYNSTKILEFSNFEW